MNFLTCNKTSGAHECNATEERNHQEKQKV